MGRKRKPRRQGAAARAAAKWKELALYHFDFILLWHPPRGEYAFEEGRSPWQTWKEYLADWITVREYVRTLYGDDNWGLNPGMVPYAEVLYQIWGAGGPPEDMTFKQVWEAVERWERERSGDEGHDPATPE